MAARTPQVSARVQRTSDRCLEPTLLGAKITQQQCPRCVSTKFSLQSTPFGRHTSSTKNNRSTNPYWTATTSHYLMAISLRHCAWSLQTTTTAAAAAVLRRRSARTLTFKLKNNERHDNLFSMRISVGITHSRCCYSTSSLLALSSKLQMTNRKIEGSRSASSQEDLHTSNPLAK